MAAPRVDQAWLDAIPAPGCVCDLGGQFHADPEAIVDILRRPGEGERLGKYPARLVAKMGGPPVRSPDKRGFGIVSSNAASARNWGDSVRLDFEPAGASCRIEVPMSRGAR